MTRGCVCLVLMVLSLSAPVRAQAPPAVQATNTVRLADVRIRDACILADEATKTYYLVASARRGVRAFTSKDLVNWQGPQIIFNTPSNFWGDVNITSIWAPELHAYKGKYYLFLTFDTTDRFPEQWRNWLPRVRRGSQVLVADSPLGPFKPFQNHSTLPVDMMTLDGTLWVEDGVPYMVFCHEWVQITNGSVEYVRLKDDLSETVGEPVTLFHGSEAPWSVTSRGRGSNVTDGPYLYRTKTGKLLMIWSSSGKGGYTTGVAVSESGKLAGPWVQQPEPLYANDGGHGMIFRRFDGTLMLVLHAPNRATERAHLFELEDTGDTIRIKNEFGLVLQGAQQAEWTGETLVPRGLAAKEPAFLQWAVKPPMGWNSWDCFATTVTEAQTRAHADYMAEHLKRHGWEYIVVDIQWYEPAATGYNYRRNAPLVMDDWGRLLPATNRFPSAANGVGFKALADCVHGKGLKFGIHLMRGIPRQAVAANTPVKGTTYHAQDIVNTNSVCRWNSDMYGVDLSKPGAQEYYDSVFDLIASWGVDYVKVDDISRPYHDNEKEIEAVRRAIDRTGRPMVLSLSPGETALTAAEHVKRHANLWRISDDFWDNWRALYAQFERLKNWNPHRGPGHWPDADMLPFGVIDMGRRKSRFTPDEQYTVMTLWSIARSPLMHGGDMTKMDEFTLSLLTNDEVIAVNQNSANNRPLFNQDKFIAWIADAPDSSDKYLAVFNARDKPAPPDSAAGAKVPIKLAELGFAGPCRIRDLWRRTDLGEFKDEFAPEINWHGAGLYRVSGSRP